MYKKTVNQSVVFTNCTGRKLQDGRSIVHKANIRAQTVDELAGAWCSRLRGARELRPAESLYAGRSFKDARRVATLLDGQLLIASAGLGLVAATDCVPSYDLTVSEASSSSVLPTLRSLGATPADWWASLNATLGRPTPISAAMSKDKAAVWYLAMPGTYLAMLNEELVQLPESAIKRLRIFTSPAWARAAPATLAAQVLPYDDRLEGTTYAGTRNDFPHRAMRHFVEQLHGGSLSMDEAIYAVRAAMSSCSAPTLPKRIRRTDEEIASLLRENWRRYGGASGKLLRFLRDDALVRCEQSRFRDLWNALRTEIEGTSP